MYLVLALFVSRHANHYTSLVNAVSCLPQHIAKQVYRQVYEPNLVSRLVAQVAATFQNLKCCQNK